MNDNNNPNRMMTKLVIEILKSNLSFIFWSSFYNYLIVVILVYIIKVKFSFYSF